MKTLASLVEGNRYKMLLTLRIAFCLFPRRCLLCAHWFEWHFLNIRETNQVSFGGFPPKAAFHRKFWWSVSHDCHGNVFTWLSQLLFGTGDGPLISSSFFFFLTKVWHRYFSYPWDNRTHTLQKFWVVGPSAGIDICINQHLPRFRKTWQFILSTINVKPLNYTVSVDTEMRPQCLSFILC